MNNRLILATLVAFPVFAGATFGQEKKPVATPPNAVDQVGQTPGGPGTPRPSQPVIRKLQTGSPNSWFDRTKLFMGEFLNKETVSGKFSFKNPGKQPVEWKNLSGSCQCVRAVITCGNETWELTKKPVANSLHKVVVENGKEVRKRVRSLEIPAGGKGEVEVHMEMGGLQGYKEASLSIQTSDANLKQTTLSWQAKGVKLFNITPNDVFLNNMTWADKRAFKFVIDSPINPEFKLLDHEPLPEYVKVNKKQIVLPNGKKAWQVDGTFGPNADPRAGGAAIKFKTDWDGKTVDLTVIATVTPPISVTPGTFLSFGKIRKGKGAEQEITFTPNDEFSLEMTGYEVTSSRFDKKYLELTSRKDGKNLIVTVKISKDVQGSFLVRGSFDIKLNHPSMSSKSFNFNGILR